MFRNIFVQPPNFPLCKRGSEGGESMGSDSIDFEFLNNHNNKELSDISWRFFLCFLAKCTATNIYF